MAALMAILSFLMVSTWRYPSFKDLSLTRPRSPVTIIVLGAAIFLIFYYPRPALLAISATYMLSGIVLRIGGITRRRLKPPPPGNRSIKLAEPFIVRPLVAVVGGDTLLARELRELLAEVKPAPRIELISGVAEQLASEEEEPVVMVPLAASSFEGAKVAFLAGTHASSRKAFKIASKNTVLVDLTSALEEQPNARLRAPFAEKTPPKNLGAVQVIAHPAAIAIAMFLARVSECAPVRRSIIHVFEPASERGQKGLDELQQQNVAVLSFQKLKTDVFDTQLAFAMLARYGEEADEPLEGIERRVERHIASLLAAWEGIPMPRYE